MEAIGIRELKARLSEHLRRVEAGVHIVVTDRGRAIATLAPMDRRESPAWLRQLAAEGGVRLGTGGSVGLHPRIKSRGQLASQAVIEDRR